MSLGMAIPMIISLYKTLKSIISSETVVKIANAIATLAQAAAERKLQKEKDKSAEVTKKNIKETLKDTKDKITNTIKNKGKNLKNSWNDGAYKAQQGDFEQVRQIKGKDGKLVNVVKNKKTGKFMTEGYAKNMAGKGALKSVGTAAAGAAIVAASVAAAALIISKAVDYYNRYDKAAQKAKEVAESIKATADQVKATEDDFQSKLDEYDNGVKGLENLTKGTEEYKDAVREANEAAIELLNTHKDLKYEINSEGLIVINDEDLAAARR
jgi:hypothetical protein